MWEYAPYKRPFYRRPWFVVPLGTVLVIGIVALIWGLFEKARWERKASEFDYEKLSEMESASVMYDRAGNVLGRMFIQNRDQVPLEDLSPELFKAVVAAEDARFYKHHGVDYYGIVRAAVKNFQAGRTRQGASTLTQQLARNSYPEQLPPGDRGYQRKVLEMFVALEIEKRKTKHEIIGLYLNRVFFGSGFYGAEAASRGYFGKRAKDLNLSEAATLTGLLKSPNNLSPWRNRQACIEQRNYVLQRAREIELISAEEYEATVQQDLVIKNRKPTHQDSYAADLVAQQVEKLVGHDSATSDGYRIYTTIDSTLQKKTEQAVRDQLVSVERHQGYEHQTYAQYDAIFKARARTPLTADGEPAPLPLPEYLQGAAIVLDNANGGILALVGGRDFSHSQFNRALAAEVSLGTAFKPIVYAAAFENGLFPGTMVQDAVIDNRQVMIGGTTGILGEWGPERVDNKYEGMISAREALVKSKNAATVRLGNMAKLEKVISLAKSAGIESPLRPFPATFLGSSEVTLAEMTLANTMFAKGGVRPVKPFIIERIEDRDRRVIFQAKPESTRVLRPATAYEVHTCLAEVLTRGTGENAFTDIGLKKFALGGKTGTAYNFTDVSFIGYSSAVTCGVWAGFDKRSTIHRGAFSNEIALPIWSNIMKATFSDYRPEPIVEPKGIIKCEICASSGLLATDKCYDVVDNKETGEKIRRRTTFFEIATDEQAPKEPCDVHSGTPRSIVKAAPSSSGEQAPRAIPVANVAVHRIVPMKSSTVIGEADPYNSVQSVNNLINAQKLNGQVAPMDSSRNVPAPDLNAPKAPEVRRPEPVRPSDQIVVKESPIKVDPPEPITF
ncbi:MAG: glycosyl transferase family 51 [Chthoniobacteraceae bacterium]|nr:glycosyl transferase family 51 [Chthoniobacteraceae bacterium]